LAAEEAPEEVLRVVVTLVAVIAAWGALLVEYGLLGQLLGVDVHHSRPHLLDVYKRQ